MPGEQMSDITTGSVGELGVSRPVWLAGDQYAAMQDEDSQTPTEMTIID